MMQPILQIDLTTGEQSLLSAPADWQRAFLGGAGLSARLLYEFLTPDLDPLSAEAPLLFLTGPLTGTYGPAVGRFVVCGKSPATGLWAETNAGGFWGVALRQAGYDGLWLTGRAERPVYLHIDGMAVSLHDARHLWGLDTYTVQDILREDVDDRQLRVASIGRAGERGVAFAGIYCDHGRAAGRAGLGAVMGAKNLKAIAIHGQGKIPLHDAAAYAALRSQANRDLKQQPITQVLHDLGSAGGAEYFDYLGEMPKMYFSAGQLEGAERISGSSVAETILDGVSACHGCVIACGRVVRLEDGKRRKGPEYETLVGFGPNLGLTDLVFATRMGEICDRLGMDVISASNVLGLAFKMYAQGRLTAADTDGLSLDWGNERVIETLLHQIAYGKGLGRLLGQGARAFARHFGAEEMAVQVKGLEVPYHDPRGASGMALVYATSPRGACHNKSDYFLVDIGQAEDDIGLVFYDRHAGAEKAANVARHQDWRSLFDNLVMCAFASVPAETVRLLVNAATGFDFALDELIQVGERAFQLKRLINHRLGMTGADDRLPPALLEPLPDGGAAGYRIPFDDMLAAYYAVRDWDAATGRPRAARLRQLGLDDLS